MSDSHLHLDPAPGIKQEVVDKYRGDLTDPGRGKHLWTMMALYRVTDPAAVMSSEVHMDRESLLTIEGPGCYKCEQIWKPGLERRFCQGTMT